MLFSHNLDRPFKHEILSSSQLRAKYCVQGVSFSEDDYRLTGLIANY